MYQARTRSFEVELAAAEGAGLSVGADFFYGSNVDSVRLRNAHTRSLDDAHQQLKSNYTQNRSTQRSTK